MANTLNLGNGNWAAKEGSLLAYNDENGNFKPLPFDFTRASSATRVNSQGLIEVVGSDQPRVDYSSGEGALLLEPSRTNLVTYSEDFNNAYWTKTNVSVVSGFSSPDGTTSAYKLISNNGGNIIARPPITQNTTHATSFYLKRVSGTGNVSIFKTDGNEEFFTLTDEWQRFTNINSVNPSNAYIGVRLYGLNDEVLVYGAQLEQGSYVTSYIPTQGAAVTRVAETCSGAGNEQVFNDSEGVLFVEVSALANDGTNRQITLSDGTTSNRVYFTYSTVSNQFQASIISSGSLIFNALYTSTDLTNYHKILIKYKQNDFSLWVNGFKIETDTSGNTPSGLKNINISSSVTSLPFYGEIKQIGYYDTALTDEQLAALTTI